MEQKQLDEVDESYFGEEFVDEEEGGKGATHAEDSFKKKSSKKSKKQAKSEEYVETAKSFDPGFKEEVKIESAKEAQSKGDSKEDLTPADPWADEEDDGGSVFKEASTWKVITAIVVILLIFSIFTGGFNLDVGSGVTGAAGASLSLTEAEEKAIGYVNTNLLQPPFIAELKSSEDAGTLYRVTLSVAGQEVDSYITKDGKYFFPQGFDTTILLDELNTGENTDELTTSEPGEDLETLPPIDEVQEEVVDELDNLEGVEPETTAEEEIEPVEQQPGEVLEEPAVEESSESAIFSLEARKWLFEPNRLTVKKGDFVEIAIVPKGLDFTFAIPEYGLKQKVTGPVGIQFTADKVGVFEFKCSDCESWRGMTGTLVVE